MILKYQFPTAERFRLLRKFIKNNTQTCHAMKKDYTENTSKSLLSLPT